MNNLEFLETIRESFKTYLEINTSRSTAKLKSLHGKIANDLQQKLGTEFTVHAQGYNDDREKSIHGRYYDKRVDITVCKNSQTVAGYSIKFVMRNYSQNSNNYFEGMLGETANIRTNAIPYFQIFIIFDKVPYFENSGKFSRYDIISFHNLQKYIALSKDNPQSYYHTPDKTLLVLLKLCEAEDNSFTSSQEYANYYTTKIHEKNLIKYSTNISNTSFDNGVILNDYSDFIERTCYTILGNLKN